MSTVWILDDDRHFQRLIASIVEPLGVGFETFLTVREAKRRLAKEGPPDLCVVDGLLPDGTGMDFIQELHRAKNGLDTQVVFVSAFFKGLKSFKELQGLGVQKVLHKPIPPEALKAELEAMIAELPQEAQVLASAEEQLKAQIAQLQQEYVKSLPGIADQLDAVCRLLGSGVTEARKEFRVAVHSLAGTAGTYGLERISSEARRLEMEVETGAAAERLQQESRRLVELLRHAGVEEEPFVEQLPRASHTHQVALLIDDDLEFANVLIPELRRCGLEVWYAAAEDEARALLRRIRPDIVLMDQHLSGGRRGTDLLKDLRAQLPPDVRVVFLTSRAQLEDRIGAASAGAALYLTKPLDGAELARVLETFLPPPCDGASVLLMDDDPKVAVLAERLLGPLGVNIRAARSPEDYWRALEEERPSLVILDVVLPVYSGFELCRATKADPRFCEVPVVFLTVRTGVADRTAAFRSGADDFIAKPLVPEEFVARVSARLRRSLQIQRHTVRDRLTGVLSRAAIEDVLAHQVRQGQRHGEDAHTTSVLLFDADNFKQINDQAGHAVGDRALMTIAHALNQSVRAGDFVGRWGGEEFLVVLAEGGSIGPEEVFERVQRYLAAHVVEGPNGWRRVLTVSAGATIVHTKDDAPAAVGRADKALYDAKRGGKNRLAFDSANPPAQVISIHKAAS